MLRCWGFRLKQTPYNTPRCSKNTTLRNRDSQTKMRSTRWHRWSPNTTQPCVASEQTYYFTSDEEALVESCANELCTAIIGDFIIISGKRTWLTRGVWKRKGGTFSFHSRSWWVPLEVIQALPDGGFIKPFLITQVPPAIASRAQATLSATPVPRLVGATKRRKPTRNPPPPPRKRRQIIESSSDEDDDVKPQPQPQHDHIWD